MKGLTKILLLFGLNFSFQNGAAAVEPSVFGRPPLPPTAWSNFGSYLRQPGIGKWAGHFHTRMRGQVIKPRRRMRTTTGKIPRNGYHFRETRHQRTPNRHSWFAWRTVRSGRNGPVERNEVGRDQRRDFQSYDRARRLAVVYWRRHDDQRPLAKLVLARQEHFPEQVTKCSITNRGMGTNL